MSTDTVIRFHLGRPQTSGPLIVYPIFGPEPKLRYRGLKQALCHGALMTEVDDRGEVNDVLVRNTTDQAVLLYEGELITGARQNRTIDQPVLIPADGELKVPVSCVEQGRWEDRRRSDRFTIAGHAVDPELRRSKRATANRRSAHGGAARPEQMQVWEVAARLDAHAVAAPSGAFTDLFQAQRPALDRLSEPIGAVGGQIGAVAELAGRPVALDLVSRSDVFADLLPRLVDGYALQALEHSYTAESASGGADDAAAQRFLRAVLSSQRRRLPASGTGDAFAASGGDIEGCGLLAKRELVALSAFPAK
jgi:hypothetical protein